MKMKQNQIAFDYQIGFTHGGIFHADDVFSTAFLKLLNPNIVIERGSCIPEHYAGIVYDIGEGQFDHHQKDKECRENGIPYASFGKLWKCFAPSLFSEYVVKKVDDMLISGIDKTDNDGTENAISRAIHNLNPCWDSEEDREAAFEQAVIFASEILKREIDNAQSKEEAKNIVKTAAMKSDEGILILPHYCPWREAVSEIPEVAFVIYPSLRGGYNIQTVPKKENEKKPRVLFPKEWLGNPDASLGMTFCHKGNFLAATKTLEQAVHVAKIAIHADQMAESKTGQ